MTLQTKHTESQTRQNVCSGVILVAKCSKLIKVKNRNVRAWYAERFCGEGYSLARVKQTAVPPHKNDSQT